MKSMTFREITRARINLFLGLQLFQRLTNPSLACGSNCISSKLSPLKRNLHIASHPDLFPNRIAESSELEFQLIANSTSIPLLKMASYYIIFVLHSGSRSNWLFIFGFHKFYYALMQWGNFSSTFSLLEARIENSTTVVFF